MSILTVSSRLRTTDSGNLPLLVLEACQSRLTLSPVLLLPGKYLIGSAPECDIRLEIAGVEARHCQILVGGKQLILKAWAPKTWVNNGPAREFSLRPNDRLVVGPVELRLRAATALEIAELTGREHAEADAAAAKQVSETHAAAPRLSVMTGIEPREQLEEIPNRRTVRIDSADRTTELAEEVRGVAELRRGLQMQLQRLETEINHHQEILARFAAERDAVSEAAEAELLRAESLRQEQLPRERASVDVAKQQDELESLAAQLHERGLELDRQVTAQQQAAFEWQQQDEAQRRDFETRLADLVQREAQLAACQAELNQAADETRARDVTLARRDAELANREQRLQTLEEAQRRQAEDFAHQRLILEHNAAQLAETAAELRAERQAVADLKMQWEQQVQAAAAERLSITEQSEAISAQSARFARREQVLADDFAVLDRRSRQIADRQADVQQREQACEDGRKRLDRQAASQQERAEEIANQAVAIAAQRELLESRTQQLSEQQNEMQERRHAADAAQRELEQRSSACQQDLERVAETQRRLAADEDRLIEERAALDVRQQELAEQLAEVARREREAAATNAEFAGRAQTLDAERQEIDAAKQKLEAELRDWWQQKYSADQLAAHRASEMAELDEELNTVRIQLEREQARLARENEELETLRERLQEEQRRFRADCAAAMAHEMRVRNERQHLDDLLEQSAGSTAALRTAHEEVLQQRSALEAEQAQLAAERRRAESDRGRLAQELTSAELRRQQSESERRKLESERLSVQEQLARLNTQFDAEQAQLSMRQAVLEARETDCLRREKEHSATIEHSASETEQRLAAARLELDREREQLDAERAEMAELKQALATERMELARRQKELTTANQHAADLQQQQAEAELARLAQRSTEIAEELARREAALSAEQDRLLENESRLQTAVTQLADRERTLAAREADCVRHETELAAATAQTLADQHAELETLRQQLAEERASLQYDRDSLAAREQTLETDRANLACRQADLECLQDASATLQTEQQQLVARQQVLDAREQSLQADWTNLAQQQAGLERVQTADARLQAEQQELAARQLLLEAREQDCAQRELDLENERTRIADEWELQRATAQQELAAERERLEQERAELAAVRPSQIISHAEPVEAEAAGEATPGDPEAKLGQASVVASQGDAQAFATDVFEPEMRAVHTDSLADASLSRPAALEEHLEPAAVEPAVENELDLSQFAPLAEPNAEPAQTLPDWFGAPASDPAPAGKTSAHLNQESDDDPLAGWNPQSLGLEDTVNDFSEAFAPADEPFAEQVSRADQEEDDLVSFLNLPETADSAAPSEVEPSEVEFSPADPLPARLPTAKLPPVVEEPEFTPIPDPTNAGSDFDLRAALSKMFDLPAGAKREAPPPQEESEAFPIPTEEVFVHTPPPPQRPEVLELADTDPDSISAYMERLLARSRRTEHIDDSKGPPVTTTRSAPQVESPPPAIEKPRTKPAPVIAPADSDDSADDGPEENLPEPGESAEIENADDGETSIDTLSSKPRHNAQELRAGMDSLRQVANLSARSAIAAYNWKRLQGRILITGALTLVTLILTGVLLSSPHWAAGSYVFYGCCAGLLSLVSGAELVRSLLVVYRSGRPKTVPPEAVAAAKEARAKANIKRPTLVFNDETPPTPMT